MQARCASEETQRRRNDLHVLKERAEENHRIIRIDGGSWNIVVKAQVSEEIMIRCPL
jgi:hypothetical protein